MTDTAPTGPDCLWQTRLDHAAELEFLDPPARVTMARALALETGGSLTVPRPGDSWSSHWAELSLLGVQATGDTPAEAVALWIRAVFRMDAAAGADAAPAALPASARATPAGRRAPADAGTLA